MKNVLYVGPAYLNHRGGIGAVLEVYAANIRPFKFISTYSGKGIFKDFFVYLKAIISLTKTLITDKEIKIVHIHSSSRGSFVRKSILTLISKIFGKKVVFHVHGSEFHIFYKNAGLLKPYIRFILSKVDVLICLSGWWKTFFETNFSIKQVAIINNVIQKAAEFPAVDKNNNHIRFLFLGIIGDRKGIFDLIEVLDKNKDKFSDRYTLTVGGNGEVEKLKSTISTSQLEKEIKYAGWVSGDKKNELLNNCDVYILPSYNEGLPISILEALAYGKPVISTTVGGIPEIVRPGYNGWLMEAGDRIALQEIIADVLDNKDKLDVFGKHSLAISRNYTPEAVFGSLETLYGNLIKK
jgi:glycosyltransferase involved in cell wall biosynthesis